MRCFHTRHVVVAVLLLLLLSLANGEKLYLMKNCNFKTTTDSRNVPRTFLIDAAIWCITFQTCILPVSYDFTKYNIIHSRLS